MPLHLWLQAIHLMVSGKYGISSHQRRRERDITDQTAWFVTHRIRERKRSGGRASMGGNGGAVEAGKTFIGKALGVTNAKNARGH